MKLSTQRLLCFVLGSTVTVIFYYTKNESYLSQLRLTKDACEFVGEKHKKPSIFTDAGYWKNNGVKCVIFENGRFRSLNKMSRFSMKPHGKPDLSVIEKLLYVNIKNTYQK